MILLEQTEYKKAAALFAESFREDEAYRSILRNMPEPQKKLAKFFESYFFGSKGLRLYKDEQDSAYLAMYEQNNFIEGYREPVDEAFDMLEDYMILDRFYQRDFAVLDLLAVQPDCRGQGKGRQMVSFFIEQCQAVKALPLVEIFGKAHLAFYLENGFTVSHCQTKSGITTYVLEYRA